MHRIDCPWCGLRDESEFQYHGDASVPPPALDATIEAAHAAIHVRSNPRGWHREWWHHQHGCRRFVQVLRHTLSHRIAATGWPGDTLEVPADGEASR